MTRWLVVGALVVLPVIADADCAWVLWSHETEVQGNSTEASSRLTSDQWHILRAFAKGANPCEGELNRSLTELEQSVRSREQAAAPVATIVLRRENVLPVKRR